MGRFVEVRRGCPWSMAWFQQPVHQPLSCTFSVISETSAPQCLLVQLWAGVGADSAGDIGAGMLLVQPQS